MQVVYRQMGRSRTIRILPTEEIYDVRRWGGSKIYLGFPKGGEEMRI